MPSPPLPSCPLLSRVASRCWSQHGSYRAPRAFGERMTFPRSYWLMSPGQSHALGYSGSICSFYSPCMSFCLDDFRGLVGCWFHSSFNSPVPSPSCTEAGITFLKYYPGSCHGLTILQSPPTKSLVTALHQPGCLSCHHCLPNPAATNPAAPAFQPQEPRSCGKYPEALSAEDLPTVLFAEGLPTPPLFCLMNLEDDFKSKPRFHLFSGILPELPF